MNKKFLVLPFLVGNLIAPVTAFSISVSYDTIGPVWYTDDISAVSTSAADMTGMTVTATFSDGGTQTLSWRADKDNSDLFGVWGDGWSLSISPRGDGEGSGKTYYKAYPSDSDKQVKVTFQPWELSTSTDSTFTLTNLFIDAGSGGTVFDIARSSEPSTTNSESGYEFQGVAQQFDKDNNPLRDDFENFRYSLVSNNSLGLEDTAVTYSGLVALAGATPVGDLYRFMSIDFGSEGFSSTTPLLFSSDTDSTTSSLVVPEPTTAFLFSTGLLALIGIGRKPKK